MESDDRVLVAYVPTPADFKRIEEQGWYRIPVRHAPKGIHAEWIGFYFGRKFGSRKYAIHYYAENLGHELMPRRMLVPNEPDHPRADELYFKIQLSNLFSCTQPIVSMRWRRVLFIHTTGDRFRDALELNDLLVEGDNYVDRAFTTLRENAAQPYIVNRS